MGLWTITECYLAVSDILLGRGVALFSVLMKYEPFARVNSTNGTSILMCVALI
jgi:hypothetical protein